MTSFLDRLVARHASEPPVRPRTVSRFQLAPGGRLPGIEQGVDRELRFEEPGRVVRRPPGDLTSQRVSDWRPEPSIPAGVSAPAAAVDRSPPLDGPDGTAQGDAVVRRERWPKSRPRHIERAVAVRKSEPDRSALARNTTIGQESQVGPETPAGAPSRRETKRTAIVPSASRSIDVVALDGPASSVVASRPQDAAVGRRLPDVVHVYIGRMEVRAVVADGAGARSGSRSDVRSMQGDGPLSLERYLAGERR